MKILEVNNVDLQGRRFNGYDLINYITNETMHSANQIVNLKMSDTDYVLPLYKTNIGNIIENELSCVENKVLSTHSILSLSGNALFFSEAYKDADLIHFHMYHNTKMSLYSLLKIAKEKKVVITFHDPWFLTGRCVHQYDCSKWKTGCVKCPNLTTLFPLNEDNCKYLWDLKCKVFQSIDIDIIVSSKYMFDMVKSSPIMNNQDNIHLIPLGVDINYFYDNETKNELKKKYNILSNHIVLFFRTQKEFKGTEYIIEALDKLKGNHKITLVTCGEKGLLQTLKDKFQIIELGIINNEEVLDAYRLCDMFLMPSKSETFGLMAVEAMACSRPVIVFDNTALPSITFAPDCGVLVENRNSDKLREAIKHLIENEEERIKRGNLGRKIVEENYDISNCNREILNIYEQSFNREKNNNNILFNKSEKRNIQEINYLKHLLYKLTKQLFSKMPKYFSEYKLYKEKLKKTEIDYSNYHILKIIENYNLQLYRYYDNISNKKIYRSSKNQVITKIQTMLFLINYNPKKILEVIYNKTIGKILRDKGNLNET